MKVGAIATGVLVGVFSFAVSAVHADQMSTLCSILNTTKSRQAALGRQIANERNPLMQDSLRQQHRQVNKQQMASLENFWSVNNRHFTDFSGVISSFEVMHYNTGPGVMLTITLPCEFTLAFQFVEITKPGWGQLNPERQSPLQRWRPALANMLKGDSVTFSGRLVPKDTSFAVMTELRKRGGVAFKVPDPYLPPTTGVFSKPAVTQGGLIWMPPIYSRNWANANAYCGGMPNWRLPTQLEAQTLVRSGAINGKGWFNPGYGQRTWTSTSVKPVVHIVVGFQNADISSVIDESEGGFTCVRTASAAPTSAANVQVHPEIKLSNLEDRYKERPAYKSAVLAIFGDVKRPIWIKDFGYGGGVTGDGLAVTIDGGNYEFYYACKPHDCGDNQLWVLISTDGHRAGALLLQDDVMAFFGNTKGGVGDYLESEARKILAGGTANPQWGTR